MVAMTYAQYVDQFAQKSPYSNPTHVTFDSGFDKVALGVTKVAHETDDPFDARWQWRHARPWKDEPARPGRRNRPHKVSSYKITKALLVPYTYYRKLDSMFGGKTVTPPPASVTTTFPASEVHIAIKAHLLIGYTGALPPVLPSLSGAAGAATPGYPELADLIREETPMANLTGGISPSLLDPATDPPASAASEDQLTEIAETWLTNISFEKADVGLCELESNSDGEMDLVQEQQCLYWGFPLELGTPNAWLRYFQVTKAFRAAYQIAVPNKNPAKPAKVYKGQVLIGVTGAGDM